jgi:hypothetical protein
MLDQPGCSQDFSADSAASSQTSYGTQAVSTASTDAPLTLAKQQRRFSRANKLANLYLTGVDFFEFPSLKHLARDAELVVYGQVTEVDRARYNTPDGTKDERTYPSRPQQYVTFYVEPDQVLKGSPRFGTPIAFALEVGTSGVSYSPVLVRDEVLVYADYRENLLRGNGEEDIYMASESHRSVFMKVGGQFVNIVEPSLSTIPGAVEAMVKSTTPEGPTGIDPDLVSTVKSLNDVTGEIAQGPQFAVPVDDIPIDLRELFESANPGERLLYVGSANRQGEMNAVLHTRNFHGVYVEESWGIDFDFFGASSGEFGPTGYPQAAVGEFRDVIPIPDSSDFYLRATDPISTKDFYVRIPLYGAEVYRAAKIRAFNLSTDTQYTGDPDANTRDFLAWHQLGELIQPGDVVRLEFCAIYGTHNGKWEVAVDERNVQIVQALTIERFEGAEAMVKLLRFLRPWD